MNIRTALLAAGAAFSLAPAVALAQDDAAAHKAWMSDAADAQDELREALATNALAKAEARATKLEAIMAKTEQYWAGKHADDIVKLAQRVARAGERDCRRRQGAQPGARQHGVREEEQDLQHLPRPPSGEAIG